MKYLRRMKKRYDRASRKERGQLLDEMEAVTDLHRKSLVRLLRGKPAAPATPSATRAGLQRDGA